MAISSSYCTHRDLKDVYPNVDEYDVKNPIYGWQATGVSNQYIANDSGLVTALFVDVGILICIPLGILFEDNLFAFAMNHHSSGVP